MQTVVNFSHHLTPSANANSQSRKMPGKYESNGVHLAGFGRAQKGSVYVLESLHVLIPVYTILCTCVI